jgi:thioredoxin reductase
MNHSDLTPVDVTIIGGGPTGLYSVYYAGLRGMSCRLIESLPYLGGRLSALYPEKYIYDVAGFPKILAKDLVTALEQQASYHSPEMIMNETVNHLHKEDDIYTLETKSGKKFASRTIIISSGIGSYSFRKHPHPEAKNWEGKGLEYQILNKNQYKDKKIVILGGGDSALDWALDMLPIAKSVTLIHRNAQFRGLDSQVNELRNSPATILMESEIIDFIGSDTLESLKVLTPHGEKTIPVDGCIIFFGLHSSLGGLKNWGLKIEHSDICVNSCMETQLPGVYAAGDGVTYEGKLKLISVGFSEGAIAVNRAKTFLNPKSKFQPIHSTTIMENSSHERK